LHFIQRLFQLYNEWRRQVPMEPIN
jgi:hypothetical protein